MLVAPISYDRIAREPVPLLMGELHRDWRDVPTRVVVNMCGVFPWGEPVGRVVFSLPMLDLLEHEAMPTRADIERFLSAAHAYASYGPTYWHCHVGLNRSGIAVASYLHLYRGMRISEAIAHMRVSRSPMVLCNSTFEAMLREWYGGSDEQDFEPWAPDAWLEERTGARDDWK